MASSAAAAASAPSLAPSTTIPFASRDRSRTRPDDGAQGDRTMAAPPLTPSKSSAAAAGAAAASASSPHYTTSLRSRHSLYGTEDRVVLDLGSHVWKLGFSGEPHPRVCASVPQLLAGERAAATSLTRGRQRAATTEEGSATAAALWGLDKAERPAVEWEVSEERLKRFLRKLWFENLMVDPKTRKLIVLENPLLPTRVKEMIARVLFDNLQVPSLSFACSPVLALMAAGTVTGLVVDVGHLETTVLPIFHSRPLFPLITTTPRAGARFNRRLRTLLLAFAAYAPAPASASSMTPPTVGRVPHELLTDGLVEEIKTRLCFIGRAPPPRRPAPTSGWTTTSAAAPGAQGPKPDAQGEEEGPDPDAALVQHLYSKYADTAESTTDVSFRIPNSAHAPTGSGLGPGWIRVPGWIRERAAEVLWEEDEAETKKGGGSGGLEDEERGLAGVTLDALLKLPIDLRKPMAASILVVGGTAMLPGFIPRFKASLLALLERSHPPTPPPSPPLSVSSSSSTLSTGGGEEDPRPFLTSLSLSASPAPRSPPTTTTPSTSNPETLAKSRRRRALTARLHTLRHSPRWASLTPLAPHLALLNHPCPGPSSSSSPLTGPSPGPPVLGSSLARAREGSAPAWTPALQAWVGGSLAGALKVSGVEINREEWDAAGVGASRVATVRGRRSEAEEREGLEEEEGVVMEAEEEEEEDEWVRRRRREARLPDWTKRA